MADVKRQITGRRSHEVGDLFEGKISASCIYYRDKGYAIIEKTPEPMRVLKPFGPRNKGQYICCFEKQAQPDYKGVLCDGRAIIFEAKHTDKDRILEAVVTDTQRGNLDDFEKMGAYCCVMVSLGLEDFFRVPWSIFRDMKSYYGRKYMKREELEPFRINQYRGALLILEGIELDSGEAEYNDIKAAECTPIRGFSPYERTRNAVMATGNRWAMENFKATH